MLAQWILFFLGIVVASVPFLQLPPAFDTTILLVAGLTVSFIAGRAVRDWSRKVQATSVAQVFEEKESS